MLLKCFEGICRACRVKSTGIRRKKRGYDQPIKFYDIYKYFIQSESALMRFFLILSIDFTISGLMTCRLSFFIVSFRLILYIKTIDTINFFTVSVSINENLLSRYPSRINLFIRFLITAVPVFFGTVNPARI